ncbi:hypothetical protein MLD38_038687 [Melastoma candidum]|uniref:Uncharacterized protein n=1 Tax=Melastoma candidum TaxID=119954 RepID=A0ACB9L0I9_9MYRT|nr:hypothetical protein MLD38_038687 [Melastoma candidum]
MLARPRRSEAAVRGSDSRDSTQKVGSTALEQSSVRFSPETFGTGTVKAAAYRNGRIRIMGNAGMFPMVVGI